jgi:hypothetical protein
MPGALFPNGSEAACLANEFLVGMASASERAAVKCVRSSSLIVSAALGLAVPRAAALDPGTAITQYVRDTWIAKDGAVGALLAVRKLPRFHETRLFLAVCGLALAGAAFGAHAYRMKRLVRREREGSVAGGTESCAKLAEKQSGGDPAWPPRRAPPLRSLRARVRR